MNQLRQRLMKKANGGANESSALIAARESLKMTISDFISAKLGEADARVAVQVLRAAASTTREDYGLMVEQVGHWEVERLLMKYWLLINEGRDTV